MATNGLEKIHVRELLETCEHIGGESTCYGEAYRQIWKRKSDGKLFAYTEWGDRSQAEEVRQKIEEIYNV